MPWSEWVSTDESHRRASGRRGFNRQRQLVAEDRRAQVRELLQRWGDSATARGHMATLLQVSVSTVHRDILRLRERQALPVICPLCHLPSRIDLDPTDLTDDPDELARLEQAMARLIGMADPEATPRRRPIADRPHATRRQRDDRPDQRAQTLGETPAHAWD